MLLDAVAAIFFLSGIVLMIRWLHAALYSRITTPAGDYSFTLQAMRDRRYRRRSGLYLGTGLLCIGIALFLSGMAVQT